MHSWNIRGAAQLCKLLFFGACLLTLTRGEPRTGGGAGDDHLGNAEIRLFGEGGAALVNNMMVREDSFIFLAAPNTTDLALKRFLDDAYFSDRDARSPKYYRTNWAARAVTEVPTAPRKTLGGLTLIFSDRVGNFMTHYFHFLEQLLMAWATHQFLAPKEEVRTIIFPTSGDCAAGTNAYGCWRGQNDVPERMLKALFPEAQVLAETGLRRLSSANLLILSSAVVVDRGACHRLPAVGALNKMIGAHVPQITASLPAFQKRLFAGLGVLGGEARTSKGRVRVTVVDRAGKNQRGFPKGKQREVAEMLLQHPSPFAGDPSFPPGADFPVDVQTVDFANLSFQQQVQEVFDTDILVGSHGNGLTHVIYLVLAPNVTKLLVEVFSPESFTGDYNLLGELAGVRHVAWDAGAGSTVLGVEAWSSCPVQTVRPYGNINQAYGGLAAEPLVRFLRGAYVEPSWPPPPVRCNARVLCQAAWTLIPKAALRSSAAPFLCLAVHAGGVVQSWVLQPAGLRATTALPGGEAQRRTEVLYSFLHDVAQRVDLAGRVAAAVMSLRTVGDLPGLENAGGAAAARRVIEGLWEHGVAYLSMGSMETAHSRVDPRPGGDGDDISSRDVGRSSEALSDVWSGGNGTHDGSARDRSGILIPGYTFLGSAGYAGLLKELHRHRVSRNASAGRLGTARSRPAAAWRGAVSASQVDGPGWMRAVQVRLCAEASDILDVGITEILSRDGEDSLVEWMEKGGSTVKASILNARQIERTKRMSRAPRKEEDNAGSRVTGRVNARDWEGQANQSEGRAWVMSRLKTPLPWDEMLGFKALVDVDGDSQSQEETFWKLYSDTVTLKVECGFRQWYYDKLEPWRHFVPVKCDMSDLVEKVKWVLDVANRQAVEKITRASTRVLSEVTYKGEVRRLGTLFQKYFTYAYEDHPLLRKK
eukprot:gene4472-5483_t